MRVVTLHNIIDSEPDAFDRKCSRISTQQLIDFLDHCEQHFDLISFEEIRDLESVIDNPKSVLLTFDDGFKGVYDFALAELKQRQLSAIAFVNPNHLRNHPNRLVFDFLKIEVFFRLTEKAQIELERKSYPLSSPRKRIAAMKVAKRIFKAMGIPERQSFLKTLQSKLAVSIEKTLSHIKSQKRMQTMSLQEIRELSSAGWVIGGHSIHHFEFSSLTKEEIQAEVNESWSWLRKECSGPLIPFAYPSGAQEHYSQTAVKALQESSFTHSFTTINGEWSRSCDPMQIPRYDIKEFIRQFIDGPRI